MRKIIYPQIEGGYEQELNDCLKQLNDFMDQKQLYPGSFVKHNVFIKIDNPREYAPLKKQLLDIVKRKFPLPVVLNLIPQEPAGAMIALESIYVDSRYWNGLYRFNDLGSCQSLQNKKHKLVFGSVQCDAYNSIRENSEVACMSMLNLLEQTGFKLGNVVRQWNYIENILKKSEDLQNYQVFNDVRTHFYGDAFNETGYPAATGIGMKTGGVIIEFLAVKDVEAHSKVINNPLQKAAHMYSDRVLVGHSIFEETNRTTPKFERARSLEVDALKMVMVSGTAAITGERTVAAGEIVEQTSITLENIEKLISKRNLEQYGIESSKNAEMVNLRVYVKNSADFEAVDKTLQSKYGSMQVLLLQADICRNNLLVEIEGEAIY